MTGFIRKHQAAFLVAALIALGQPIVSIPAHAGAVVTAFAFGDNNLNDGAFWGITFQGTLSLRSAEWIIPAQVPPTAAFFDVSGGSGSFLGNSTAPVINATETNISPADVTFRLIDPPNISPNQGLYTELIATFAPGTFHDGSSLFFGLATGCVPAPGGGCNFAGSLAGDLGMLFAFQYDIGGGGVQSFVEPFVTSTDFFSFVVVDTPEPTILPVLASGAVAWLATWAISRGRRSTSAGLLVALQG